MLLKCGDSDSPGVDIVGWMLLVLAVAVPIISLTLGDNFLEWSSPVEIELLISDLQRLRLSYLFLDLRPDFAKVASSMPYFERRKAM